MCGHKYIHSIIYLFVMNLRAYENSDVSKKLLLNTKVPEMLSFTILSVRGHSSYFLRQAEPALHA